ncbi:oligosaccharide flippase family protein [Marivirga harenae]|uniref:oligosaccharide flippase family protein n=1 Tax=Marivirga harenae TaxID=2010992 RepID=UPI0026E063CF|nr:oligosaccharide flippase family protein [Marivirga harenae]WKV13134.1 oligosaccharide flippase family protein [Marivirga harenae]
MKNNNTSYSNILKSTFLFGGVRVLTVLVNVVKNKIISLSMGASGIGVFGIFMSSYTLLSSLFGLGISQSLVRNLSEVYNDNSSTRLNHILESINKLLILTSTIGLIGTLCFSSFLSIWTFDTDSKVFEYSMLSLAIFFNIFNLGQLAILQGVRALKELSLATIYGAILGLLLSIPLFYLLKEEGIIYSFIITAFVSFIFSSLYVRRTIKIPTTKLSIKKVLISGKGTIKLGIAMMSVSLFVSLFGLIFKSFINKYSGIEAVGVFQAGFTIINSYFGLIFTAMATDYFPRISSINQNNKLLQIEANKQVEILLLLLGPLIIILIGFMDHIILLLYDNSFLLASDYVSWSILGIIFQAGSQTMGMVIIAKNRSKVFVISVLTFQGLFLINNIIGYTYLGYLGLGITFALNMVIHTVGVQIMVKKLFGIVYKTIFYKLTFVNILLFGSAMLCKEIDNDYIKYSILFTLLALAILFSIKYFERLMNIPSLSELIIEKLKSKFK